MASTTPARPCGSATRTAPTSSRSPRPAACCRYAKSGDAPQFTVEEVRAVVDTAHDYGFTVAAHAHGKEGMRRAIEGGVTSIEHGTYMDEEIFALMKKHGTWYVPTISAGRSSRRRRRSRASIPEIVRPKAARIGAQIQDTFGKAWRAGVKIGFGTDQGVAPHGDNAREFGYMVEAGMPAATALQTATYNAAQVLGVDGHRSARARLPRRRRRRARRPGRRHRAHQQGGFRHERRRDPPPPMMKLPTRPEALEVALDRSAIIVVDMQNAFASRGGLLDLAGIDISGAAEVVRTVDGVLGAARTSGVQVVYLQTGYKPDLSNGGSEASPNPRKETALCLMRARPELKGKLLVEGTWDFDIVPELAPQPNDIVVLKTRYSGFAGTTLDSVLRVREIRYLFFVGIATNVCVESTLRDAYFHEYWPVLVTDAAMQAGPRTAHEATIFNVESFFGWTLDSKSLIDSLAGEGALPATAGGV